jgi:hypothetical protein
MIRCCDADAACILCSGSTFADTCHLPSDGLMTPLFNKLNLKGQQEIVVLNAPESFERELDALEGVTVHRDASALERVEFALAFVITNAQVAAEAILPRAQGDAVVWFAYPKGTSKRYKCEFNRDTGWAPLGAAGFEGVRMVAIDEDWSALRLRRVEHIRTMKRDPARAATDQGRARVAKDNSRREDS